MVSRGGCVHIDNLEDNSKDDYKDNAKNDAKDNTEDDAEDNACRSLPVYYVNRPRLLLRTYLPT